ncbi:MAG: M1 family metallopeptidase [Salinarimonas sp.]
MRHLRTAAATLAVSLAGLGPADAAAEHAVTLRLDPASGTFAMHAVTTGADGALVLDGADWLEALAARAGGAAIAAADGRLVVPAARAANGPVTITADGVLPPVDGGAAAAGASPAGAFLLDASVWLPRSAAGDDAYTITVETPAPFRAVATGALVSEAQEADGSARATFRFAPHDEAPVVLAGPWLVDERSVAGLRLRTYFPAESRPVAPDYLDAAEAFIAAYAAAIGPYPYDGFAIVAAPIPVGLGFPNLTYVASSILAHPYMRGRSLAHEILHSWWGNAVGVAPGSGNWAEGLTTYQADYALAVGESPQAARAMRLDWLRDLAALPDARRRPIVDFRSSTHDGGQAVGYGKTALVLRMLEDEIGAPAFRRAVRAFYAANRFGTAGWDELRAAFETAAGRDLGWFFAQWLERAGEPRITLEAAAPLADGSGVSLTLHQEPPLDGGAPWHLPVPVRIDTEEGTIETTVRLDTTRRTFRIETPAAARAVRIDPDWMLVRALLPGETAPILRDVLATAGEIALATPSPGLGPDEAHALLGRAVGRTATLVPAAAGDDDGPTLVIGLTDDVAALAQDPDLATAGDARAWIDPSGVRLHASADTPETLERMLATLRFYGKQSLVVFADGEALRQEVLEAGDSPLGARF